MKILISLSNYDPFYIDVEVPEKFIEELNKDKFMCFEEFDADIDLIVNTNLIESVMIYKDEDNSKKVLELIKK